MITGVIIAAIIAPTILSHIWKNKYYFLIHKTAGMKMSNDYNNQDNLISEAKSPQGQLVSFTWRWLPELQRL